jgi:hypothetical protein
VTDRINLTGGEEITAEDIHLEKDPVLRYLISENMEEEFLWTDAHL